MIGDHCAFSGTEPRRTADFKDGLGNTMFVGEAVKVQIPWTKPVDIDVSRNGGANDPAGFSSDHAGGFNVLMADGSVKLLSNNIDAQVLRGLFTIDGNEHSSPF